MRAISTPGQRQPLTHVVWISMASPGACGTGSTSSRMFRLGLYINAGCCVNIPCVKGSQIALRHQHKGPVANLIGPGWQPRTMTEIHPHIEPLGETGRVGDVASTRKSVQEHHVDFESGIGFVGSTGMFDFHRLFRWHS